MAIYDAFISYSHAKDKPIAAALQAAMQKLGKPWYRRRALRVFRDDASLSATPHLWPTIEQALAESRFLIVLASPEAAASPWVAKEVAYWLEHKNAETLLIAITDGRPVWDNAARDFDWSAATPLPPVLAGRLAHEPKWVDLSAYREGANPRDAKFIELAADFAAAIHGIPKDDLLSQEVRQQRRSLTLAWSAAATLVVVTGAAAWQWNAAVKSGRIAVAETARAERNFGAAKETIDSVIFDLAQGLRDVEGMRAETVRRILGRAEAAVENLMSRTENDANVRASQAAMFSIFSDTYLRLGDTQLAADYAQKSLDIERKLLVNDPDNAVLQNNLAVTLEKFGEVLFARGDLNGALTINGESLNIRRELSAKDPSNSQTRGAISLSLDQIGRVLENQNNLPSALSQFRQSLDIARELSAKDPGSQYWRNKTEESLGNVGLVLMLQGELDGALAAFRESVNISRELFTTDPSNTLFQRDISTALNKLGYALVIQPDLTGALAAYRESMDIARGLVTKDPGNSEWHRNLSQTLEEFGDVQVAKGDLNGALANYRESLRVRRELVAKDHNNLQWRQAVSESLQKIGDVLSAQGDPDNALIAYRECVERLREITAKDASQLIWRRDLSVSLTKVGNALRNKSELNDALALYRESLVISRATAAKDPSNTMWQRDVAITLGSIGDVLATQSDFDGALATHHEAVDIWRSLAIKNPENPAISRGLSVSLNKFGILRRSQGDFTGAVAAHRESLDIARDLTNKDPGNAQWQMDVIYSLDDLARAGDDPRGRWAEALAILARLKSQGTLPPSQQGWIAKINSALAAVPDANLATSSLAAVKSVALEQIAGTYDGINEINQGHQVGTNVKFSLTIQQSGNDITATYRSALGASGRGSGTLSGNAIYMMSLQSETPNCPGSYIASFKFDGDAVSWHYTGQDCNGPIQGRGSATKTKS